MAPKKSVKKSAPKKRSSGKKKAPAYLTKSQVLDAVTAASGQEKKAVKAVMGGLMDVGHAELKKRGMFMLAGFAKFVKKTRPARKAKKGINPFTKEPCIFKARPASKLVKIRPVKLIKDAVQ